MIEDRKIDSRIAFGSSYLIASALRNSGRLNQRFRIKTTTGFLLIAIIIAGSGCSITTRPNYVRLNRSSQIPLLRLEKLSETPTGTWAPEVPGGFFKNDLLRILRQEEGATLFSTESSSMVMDIDLVSEHESDFPRLFGLGCLSILTAGIIPLNYHSEWNVQCDVNILLADRSVAAHYPVYVTGTYDIRVFPPTMFALFGGSIRGEADAKEIVRKTANNLAFNIMKSVASDYPRLAKLKESNASILAARQSHELPAPETGNYIPPPLEIHQSGGEIVGLGVMDLKSVGCEEAVGPAVTDTVRETLFKSNHYHVMNRSDMEKMLLEQNFQQSGRCNDMACIVKVGKILAVQKIVIGNVNKLGNAYKITLQLVDVESAKTDKIASEKCTCPQEQLFMVAETAAKKLLLP